MLIDVFPHDIEKPLDLPLEGVNREVVHSAVLHQNNIRMSCTFYPNKGPEVMDGRWRRLESGVYLSNLNWDHTVDMFSKYKLLHDYDDKSNLGPFYRYGVADTLAQIKDQYRRFWESDRTFFLRLTTMRRHEQSEDGGWRWHKWGQYIGTKNPQCEYLYDEPEINRAVCFSFDEIKPKG